MLLCNASDCISCSLYFLLQEWERCDWGPAFIFTCTISSCFWLLVFFFLHHTFATSFCHLPKLFLYILCRFHKHSLNQVTKCHKTCREANPRIKALPLAKAFFFPGWLFFPLRPRSEKPEIHVFSGQSKKCRKRNGSYLRRHRWRPDVSPCFLGQFHTRSLIRFRVFSLGLLLVQARSGLGVVECCFLPFFGSWPWECKVI